MGKREAIFEGAGGNNGRATGIGVACLFLLAGLVLPIFTFVRPYLELRDARDWPELPGTILESKVGRHTDSDGDDTYSIDVRYRYTFDNVEYTGDRYAFGGFTSRSDYVDKKRVVDSLPEGSAVAVYVNPADPTRAVISREFTSSLWKGLFPLVYVLVGAWLLLSILGDREKSEVVSSGETKAEFSGSAGGLFEPDPFALQRRGGAFADSGPVEIVGGQNRWNALVGLLLFAGVWNGGIWFFLISAVFADESEGVATGDAVSTGYGICSLLFFTPFVLIGLGLAGAVIYYLLVLFNPAPRLMLHRLPLRPGEPLDLEYEILGRFDRIRKLTITLEGREHATYRQGTDTRTDSETFHQQAIVEAQWRDVSQGRGRTELPTNSVPTFTAENNKVAWLLCVRGEIGWWPDMTDEFELPVAPPEPSEPSQRGWGSPPGRGRIGATSQRTPPPDARCRKLPPGRDAPRRGESRTGPADRLGPGAALLVHAGQRGPGFAHRCLESAARLHEFRRAFRVSPARRAAEL